jgi:exodeoxyribonuclease-5
MDDLAKTGAKVLFVGDPGQLPPVGDSGYFTYARPDAMLSQIMRNAGPIAQLSMKIRLGQDIDRFIETEQIIKRPKAGFEVRDFTTYDQILCGTNAMRQRLNRTIRKLEGREAVMPEAGEKLICLKNNYKMGGMLTNGIQAISTSSAVVDSTGDWVIDMLYDGEPKYRVPLYDYPFQSHYNPNAEQEPIHTRQGMAEFDYAYCITVHKSQGSEWEKVAVVDDGLFSEDRNFRKRWLYTAITRAKDRLLWLT